MPNTPLDLPGAPAALESLRPKLLARPAPTEPFRLNPDHATRARLKVAESFGQDKATFAKMFTTEGFDPEAHADVEARALALWAADGIYRATIDPAGAAAKLIAEASPLRKKLLKDAVYLFEDDPEQAENVRKIRSGTGHDDMANDLAGLSTLLGAHYGLVKPLGRVTEADLKQAASLAAAIKKTAPLPGSKEERHQAISDAQGLRDRAAEHYLEADEAIRRAADFVFGDASDRVERGYPSPYGANHVRRGRSKSAPVATP